MSDQSKEGYQEGDSSALHRLFDRLDRVDRTIGEIKGEIKSHGIILSTVQTAAITLTDHVEDHASGTNAAVATIAEDFNNHRRARWGVVLSSVGTACLIIGGIWTIAISATNVRIKQLERRLERADEHRQEDDRRERVDAAQFAALKAGYDKLDALNDTLHKRDTQRLDAIETRINEIGHE